ncbi:protein of unknown function [Kyrpidia spormannii]|uniref:Uncharacterized protein n=2 Tax=Kyrpidia spormannii TaxID=2055160 RepID=A0ACA8Z4Y4_9BACL|nr:protein of unknown function [Kyrpidia spormannii]CAB3390198.1 protein of unknown function [Kyrpidia spormannii]
MATFATIVVVPADLADGALSTDGAYHVGPHHPFQVDTMSPEQR